MRDKTSLTNIKMMIEMFISMKSKNMTVSQIKNIIYGHVQTGNISKEEEQAVYQILGIENTNVFKESVQAKKLDRINKAMSYLESTLGNRHNTNWYNDDDILNSGIEALRRTGIITDTIADNLKLIYGIEDMQIKTSAKLDVMSYAWLKTKIVLFGELCLVATINNELSTQEVLKIQSEPNGASKLNELMGAYQILPLMESELRQLEAKKRIHDRKVLVASLFANDAVLRVRLNNLKEVRVSIEVKHRSIEFKASSNVTLSNDTVDSIEVIYLGDRQRDSGACKPCDLETKCKLAILRLEKFRELTN